MSANPFPYRHHLAVGERWLLDTLRDAVQSHREQLQIRCAIATLQGENTRELTRELCYADAALEQLTQEEGNLHATP